jgi:hypothetical protein
MLPIMDGEEGEEMKEVVERNDVAAPAKFPGEDGEEETFVVGRQSKTDEEKEEEIGTDAVEAVEGPVLGFGMSIFFRCKLAIPAAALLLSVLAAGEHWWNSELECTGALVGNSHHQQQPPIPLGGPQGNVYEWVVARTASDAWTWPGSHLRPACTKFKSACSTAGGQAGWCTCRSRNEKGT